MKAREYIMAPMTTHLTPFEKLLTRQIYRHQGKLLFALTRSHMRRLKVAESSHTGIILALVRKFFFKYTHHTMFFDLLVHVLHVPYKKN
jgi:hypothetical protein